MPNLNTLISVFDTGLRTLLAKPQSARAHPDADIDEAELSHAERQNTMRLMRVNHTGEVCAQALYQGQALTARTETIKTALRHAAQEEVDHLAWTAERIDTLGGRPSLLNPLFYTGALSLGVIAGLIGDKWNLGFLSETEKQVEAHLQGHQNLIPERDKKSQAIVAQMAIDEAEHAQLAELHGAAPLPLPVRLAMKASAKIMTHTTYWV